EAARVRMIRELRAVMPLAESAGSIAGCLERLGNGLFVQVKRFRPGGDAADAAARMISSGQELGTRRRADSADIEAVEDRAITRDGVDSGRREIGIAVDTEVAPSLVVGQDDDDIR